MRDSGSTNGFWAILVCFILTVLELTLGLASFSACLHYDDIVERLQLYNKLSELAQQYPGKIDSCNYY